MFIKGGFKEGDRVCLTENIDTYDGTFIKGHPMFIESVMRDGGFRRYYLIDDEGNKIHGGCNVTQFGV